MPESAIETSGPSLEQILWRAMDRFAERPALVDSEEFAKQIEGAFDGSVPAEVWAHRFYEGGGDKGKAPADMAEAIVRSTRKRLAVYEFDLRRLEYVIVEDDKKVVVVSGLGQFALQNDDVVSRAIESAVIPDSATRSQAGLQRGGDPRGYFVRSSGEVVAVDVKKVARSLEQLLVRQVSMPAVEKPGARMLPFGPVRRAMSESREARALRQDARTRQAVPTPPPLSRTDGAKTTGGQTALFILMPDGSLARPEMGSATRWREMVGQYARNAAASVQTANVIAIVHQGGEGTVGERALAKGEGISAVRGGSAPVRVLGDDELARAFARGAMMVPGLSRADKFWIQPEAAFKPDDKALAQGGSGSARGAVVGQPLQLGEITGDPWGDWALTGGGALSPDVMTALRGRTRHALRAALERGGDDASIAPALADRVRGVHGKDLRLSGGAVVGFRAPDGSVVLQRGTSPIRLAAVGRLEPIDLQLPGTDAGVASRSGAIPATALAALQMALEQTANASGFRLPKVSIDSARDAIGAGAALQLDGSDPRRTSVRLAGPVSTFDRGSSQVAQLVLSMPFPNQGELHVGTDLSDALQSYLAGSVQPVAGNSYGSAAGGVLLQLRGGSAFDAGRPPLDWGALHTQAIGRAQDSVVTLELPAVQPLLAGSSSVSGLPLLLQRALAQSGDWTPGPGAPMPGAIRDLALRGPFEMAGGVPDVVAAMPQTRPLNPGEEEIVIPMPLWAQMGRGQLSETDQIMASPLAPSGYAAPMGVYRLVVPGGGPVDLTGGAPSGTSGMVDLSGPTGLEIVARGGGVRASSLGGRQFLGRVALDDGETAVTRRGRIRIGAPIQVPSPGVENIPAESGFQSDSVLSQGGSGSFAAPAVVSGAPTSMPRIDVPSGTWVGGTYSAVASDGNAPMTGALSSALQMSSDVGARTSMPGRPAVGSGASSAPAITSDGSGFRSRALAAGQKDAAATSSAPMLPTAGGNDQTLVATSLQSALAGAQVGSAVVDMSGASSSAARAAESSGASGGTPGFITGLQPGMWSGSRRNDTFGYQNWSWSSGLENVPRSAGGISLGALGRPTYPSLPTSLRFRYVGAPLWWSGSTRGGALDDDSAPESRAMRAGLRAATSAASIWRSILVSRSQWGGASDDLTGGMDSARDANADEMSSLSRRFDAITSASLVGAGAAAGMGGAAYVAVDGAGAAGTVSRAAAARARADSIEMSIVAAIPPAPPPLESMSSGMTSGDAPRARGKGHGHGGHGGHQAEKETADAVSHSKIEGSVDAIAQRIYHRIRRRIQSDRERFGG